MGSSLGLTNMVAVVDNNNFQTMGRTSETHPTFYPVGEKLAAFGWEAVELDGHDSAAIFATIDGRSRTKPLAIVAKTIKGKGISYMEGKPIWHYRSPNPEEYRQAIAELESQA
jgi:transketolase